jgi:protein-L-isoaspartate(D-aspartate) O-methyltransferase
MVEQIRLYGVTDAKVLSAMGQVRREAFFPDKKMAVPEVAYGDFPVPIGWQATISQPYIIAYMTARLALQPGERVLEIGTGSGYQAAVLAAMGMQVWSLEVVPELAAHAKKALAEEGFTSVHVRCSTGVWGWREESPFDAIIVTCSPVTIPNALVEQLKIHGRMIIPIGSETEGQRLVLVRRQETTVSYEDDLSVRFVPMK